MGSGVSQHILCPSDSEEDAASLSRAKTIYTLIHKCFFKFSVQQEQSLFECLNDDVDTLCLRGKEKK